MIRIVNVRVVISKVDLQKLEDFRTHSVWVTPKDVRHASQTHPCVYVSEQAFDIYCIYVLSAMERIICRK